MSRLIRGTNVAVVGGAGFLGSHVVNHLVDDLFCDVLVIDNLITGRKEFINRKARFEYADVTGSENYLLKLFKQHKTRYVLNYSAEPYIPKSFARPIHVADINYLGALKVINAAQEAGCEGILQISSAEIYGEGNLVDTTTHETKEWRTFSTRPIDEYTLVKPHSTYGAAKAAIDFTIQARWKEAQTPCISLRQFNCLGERETHPYVVPEIISQLNKAPYVKLGNDSARDFLYAGDQAALAVELLEKGEFGEVYNLGSESAIKIYDLAHIIADIMGHPDIEIEVDQSRIRPWEIWHLQSCNDKIYSVISGRPKVGLVEALNKTVDYYKANNCSWGF